MGVQSFKPWELLHGLFGIFFRSLMTFKHCFFGLTYKLTFLKEKKKRDLLFLLYTPYVLGWLSLSILIKFYLRKKEVFSLWEVFLSTVYLHLNSKYHPLPFCYEKFHEESLKLYNGCQSKLNSIWWMLVTILKNLCRCFKGSNVWWWFDLFECSYSHYQWRKLEI